MIRVLHFLHLINKKKKSQTIKSKLIFFIKPAELCERIKIRIYIKKKKYNMNKILQ